VISKRDVETAYILSQPGHIERLGSLYSRLGTKYPRDTCLRQNNLISNQALGIPIAISLITSALKVRGARYSANCSFDVVILLDRYRLSVS
jgi:hypothetical protein